MLGPKESGGFAVPNLRRYFEAACWSWIKEWILLKDTEVLMLEGWDKIYGWHGYLFYGKIKQHKRFTNHLIRKALSEVWERTKERIVGKTPWWIAPLEATSTLKSNVKAIWPTYRELAEEINGNIKLKNYEELQTLGLNWLEFYQLKATYKKGIKTRGFEKQISKFEKQVLQSDQKHSQKCTDY